MMVYTATRMIAIWMSFRSFWMSSLKAKRRPLYVNNENFTCLVLALSLSTAWIIDSSKAL